MSLSSPLAAFFGISPVAWAMLAVFFSVFLLTIIIASAKVQPLIAFVLAALVAAFLLGMPIAQIPKAIEKGIGDLLGSLTVIICLGAVFGKLIADSGAAQRIASFLIDQFGQKRMPLALMVTGFVAGIPLYYNVGFVLLVPLVFSLVYQTGRPAVALAIPLVCGLSIAHGFLPPHPSPTALAGQFEADIGRTLLLGIVVGIPTLLIAGPLFAMTLKNVKARPSSLFTAQPKPQAALPGAFNSFATALLPVWLLAGFTVLILYPSDSARINTVVAFFANPLVIMLVAFAVAVVTLGLARGQSLPAVMALASMKN